MEEEKKDSDIATICHLCGEKVSGPALKWNGVEVTGALMTHMSDVCSYFKKYRVRISEFAKGWKEHLEE